MVKGVHNVVPQTEKGSVVSRRMALDRRGQRLDWCPLRERRSSVSLPLMMSSSPTGYPAQRGCGNLVLWNVRGPIDIPAKGLTHASQPQERCLDLRARV